MEGNLSTGALRIPSGGSGSSYGVVDLQGSTPVKPLQQHVHVHVHGLVQQGSIEDEATLNEDGVDPQSEPEKGKEEIPLWHRVRWTDSMGKLLVTALSYIDEDLPFGRRKCVNLHKKGKWKTVSKVMAERGYCVSPQQCEDKFNDLNKRYKKLNDILGRGTSCQVVENPALLEVMSHLSDKAKDEVRKILSSKHLLYEEMCSYHNNNRLNLPPDPALKRSILLAIGSRDDQHDDVVVDEDDYDGETGAGAAKRMKQGEGTEEFCLGLEKQSQGEAGPQEFCLESRLVQLEQQKLKMKMEKLEMDKERFEWERVSSKKDREVEKMKVENERMKIANEEMAVELKRMEMRYV